MEYKKIVILDGYILEVNEAITKYAEYLWLEKGEPKDMDLLIWLEAEKLIKENFIQYSIPRR
jgi:hypothetical protein